MADIPPTSLEINPDDKTTIQIRKSTATDLTDCKHGKTSYDVVITKLIAFYRKATGKTIVD
jgi:predicted CopG family antitoxin